MGQAIIKDSHYDLVVRIFYHCYSLYTMSFKIIGAFLCKYLIQLDLSLYMV